MESTLVTELRSLTATALTATSAAERGAWDEAHRAASDMNARTQRVLRLLASTHDELKGKGDSREFFPTPTAGPPSARSRLPWQGLDRTVTDLSLASFG